MDFRSLRLYSTHTNKKITFLVIEDINSNGYTFKVTP